jgi:hypothetical protein
MRMKRLCKWNYRWTSPFWYLGPWGYLVKTTPIYQNTLSPGLMYQYCVNHVRKSLLWLFMENKWMNEWMNEVAGHLPLLVFPAAIIIQARTETTLSKGNTVRAV